MAEMTSKARGDRQMQAINAARLRRLKACEPMVEKFVEIFGEADAPLTVETAIANAAHFNWGWAAKNLLPATHRQAYREAVATLRRAYREAEARIFAELYLSTGDTRWPQ